MKPDEGPDLELHPRETACTSVVLPVGRFLSFFPQPPCQHGSEASMLPWIYKRKPQRATVVDCVRLDTVTKVSHRISHSSVPAAVLVMTMSQAVESAEKRTFGRTIAHLLLSS